MLNLGAGGLLVLLSQVDLHVSAALVTAGELPATLLTGEWFLSCVCADVCGQVVTAAEVPHADAALEGFVSGVDAEVAAQFV